MKRSVVAFVLGNFFAFSAFAQIPNGYYDDVEGLSGEPMRTALRLIIDNHDVQSYGSLWNHFQETDKKANGKVWDMYSDVPGGTPPYTWNFGNDQCGNYNSEADCYNREHSFPKSWFGEASPMQTDIFHLYPTDGYVNGFRGNHPYGETSSATWTSMNGSKRGFSNYDGYTGVVFEPIDEYKGDFARTYFYMLTRYQNLVSGWNSEMLEGDNFTEWARVQMILWHIADPVSEKEINRNNAVYDIQDNRNPFIDHPEWVEAIWGEPTSVADFSQDNSIAALYFGGQIHIKHTMEIANVSLVDLTGKKVANWEDVHVDFSTPIALESGIYVALIQSNSGHEYSQKFLVR